MAKGDWTMIKEKNRLHISFTRETLLWLIVLLAVVCLALGLTVDNYADKFLPHTTVNGVDCTSLSAGDAVERLVAAANRETMEFRDEDGRLLYTAPLGELVNRESLRAQLATLLAEQKQGKSGFAFLLPGNYAYETELYRGQSTQTLQDWLDGCLYGDTVRVEPSDAYLELSETGYRLVPEVMGNAVNTRKCALELGLFLARGDHLDGGQTHVVTVREGRLLPRRTTESAVLQAQLAELDRYFGNVITVDFENGHVITLDAETIYSLSQVTVTFGSAHARPVEELVAAYVEELAGTYGSHGTDRKYLNVASTRDTVHFREGDWGFEMDVEKLTADVLSALKNREPVTVTPEYYCTSYLEWRYGLGSTLVEISIDNQYMWFYLNGRLMTETPVVTGNVATWDITRKGVFSIYWKKADTILRGPTWNDHVDFWMPFDDQIGLHDSSWRSEYGGDIYLTDGSHGCVNTPWEPMSIIFNNTWLGVPVIVY